MCNMIMTPTIKFMILQSFENSSGCWTMDFCILPPIFKTSFINIWVKLKYLLFASNLFFLLLSFPNYLLCTNLMISISAASISLKPINFSLQFLFPSSEGSSYVLTDPSDLLLHSKTNAKTFFNLNQL